MELDIKSELLKTLKKVKGPNLVSNIVDLGLVSEIQLTDNKVTFSISVPSDIAETLEPLRAAAEKVAKSVDGIETALVILTSSTKAVETEIQASPTQSFTNSEMGAISRGTAKAGEKSNPGRVTSQKLGLPQGIKSIIAISSGKGGVGKSTTSVNVALAMQEKGMKVAILDADIYGPSLPRLLGISGRPTQVTGRIIKPLNGFGIKVISMGFLVDEETPMIWRGPMVISAITQMLREVQWGEIDMLVVDMPPGTGDVQLTLAQQVPLAGAVIVSTPQDLALIDARKGLNMFRQVEVPVLGIIENMSYFICPHCGTNHEIFGHGGAKKEAERIGVPFLGGVPLDQDIRTNSDAGTPIIISDPEGEHAKTYTQITENILERIKQEEEMINRTAIVIE